jgi:hypothetical protein
MSGSGTTAGSPPPLPATFSYTQARQAGLAKRRLYAMRDAGTLDPVGRGLYRHPDAPLADLDLLEVAYRAPDATICLTTALAHHGLSDALPTVHDLALPRGHRHPAVSAPIRWHSFDRATFTSGRDTLPLDSQTSIGLYDAPRSIVDAFRLRSTLGSDIAHEALRRWVRSGGDVPTLLDRAALFPSTLRQLRLALSILL